MKKLIALSCAVCSTISLTGCFTSVPADSQIATFEKIIPYVNGTEFNHKEVSVTSMTLNDTYIVYEEVKYYSNNVEHSVITAMYDGELTSYIEYYAITEDGFKTSYTKNNDVWDKTVSVFVETDPLNLEFNDFNFLAGIFSLNLMKIQETGIIMLIDTNQEVVSMTVLGTVIELSQFGNVTILLPNFE